MDPTTAAATLDGFEAFVESPLGRLGDDEHRKMLHKIPRETALCRLVALTCSCWATFVKARFESAPGPRKLAAAAVFDLDGVLLDSERAGSEAVAEVLSEHGWHVKAETVIDCYLGWSASRLVSEAANEGHNLPAHVEQELEQRRETKCKGCKVVAGVAEALKELKDEGVLLCATSVWGSEALSDGLKRHRLETYFDHIASSAQESDIYLKCSRALGVSRQQCIAIDDSSAGIQRAAAAGCCAIGFMGGSHLGNGWVDSFMFMNAGALTAAPTMKDVTSLVRSQTKQLSWK